MIILFFLSKRTYKLNLYSANSYDGKSPLYSSNKDLEYGDNLSTTLTGSNPVKSGILGGKYFVVLFFSVFFAYLRS